ncbi:MAG: DNA gyrase inhibitor YacG [Gammaproteobacteria bacterium]|nr:DNA gyrase inhibitor YacG [Gammaproteobacteria bacterium]
MKKLIVACPCCSKKHDYYQNKPWSPFCSERCQLIDLGAWASEAHRIQGESIPAPDTELQSKDVYFQNGDFIN